MNHEFTETIATILRKNFGLKGDELLETSPIISYLNIKTRSASRDSKARGSFANIYAVYVLVEDYVTRQFHRRSGYSKYEGAKFSDLFIRQRDLPFGGKLQNHGLNSRMNEEFKKYFPTIDSPMIIRDVGTQRYWINESMLRIKFKGQKINLAESILQIVNAYVEAKQSSFNRFIEQCDQLSKLTTESGVSEISAFVEDLLKPNVDARLFEIVSYAILKSEYGTQTIWIGAEEDSVREEYLSLFKTGRTNANDGGIDFVMKPIGRFFQVTETLDVHKYFLDIDKVQHFPITFVVKTEDPVERILKSIRDGAETRFPIDVVVEKYMAAIEEVINLPKLRSELHKVIARGDAAQLIGEIVLHSKVEFNFVDD